MVSRYAAFNPRSAATALAIACSFNTICTSPALAAETGERSASHRQPVAARTAVLTAPTTRSTCGIPAFDQRILDYVNRLRSRGGSCGERGVFSPARPLGWSERLSLSADVHAIDMAAHNYFSHVGRADGRSVEHRLAAAGQAWGEYAENLAAGLTTVEEVITRWVNSPAHCANLLNPNFTELGAACAPAGSASRFKTYWALDLIGP